MNNSTAFSLLRPASAPPPTTAAGLSQTSETDLGLDAIVRALDPDGRHSRFINTVLAELTADPAVIGYRQAVLQELLEHPALVEGWASVLPQLLELAAINRNRRWAEAVPLQQVAGRLAELELYLECVEKLWAGFETVETELQAAGLQDFQAFLKAVRQDEQYRRLTAELPRLRAQLNQAASVTIGVNLDAQLRPEAATLLSINPERFSGKGTLFERLFGGDKEAVRSLGQLYRATEPEGRAGPGPEHELFKEMNRLLERVAGPVAESLSRFTRFNTGGLSGLEPELAFYVGAARLITRLRGASLSLTFPQIQPVTEGISRIEGCYNLELALRSVDRAQGVVANEVRFEAQARIFVLTGPNSGGKTTYTRAVGQAQVLFQAGLPVPGQVARLSPVDRIFTHFATAERPTQSATGGRLTEELERLALIFRQATSASLILLNEPLASTDHASARLLSRDILAGLRMLGARTIFVTHIYELADDAASDGWTAPDGIISLVAGIKPPANEGQNAAPTYTITPGRPRALGYAAELARQHGLSLGQIEQVLRDRQPRP